MSRIALVLLGLIVVASAQWAGFVRFDGNTCTNNTKAVTYSSSRVLADGCLATIEGSTSRLKFDCATGARQTCNVNCTNCVDLPDAPSSSCTTSGSCTTCVENSVTYSFEFRCSPLQDLGVVGAFAATQQYSSGADCSDGAKYLLNGVVANGQYCSLSFLSLLTSATYLCFSNGTMVENYYSASTNCTGAFTPRTVNQGQCVIGVSRFCTFGTGPAAPTAPSADAPSNFSVMTILLVSVVVILCILF